MFRGSFIYPDSLHLEVDLAPDEVAASGMLVVQVSNHPDGSAETFKSFAWDRAAFIREHEFNFDDGDGDSTNPHDEEVVGPTALRRAYEQYVKSLQP